MSHEVKLVELFGTCCRDKALQGCDNNNNNTNNTLFVQYHEQEIPEVIPIEGIPFVNQSKSNQINLTQHK